MKLHKNDRSNKSSILAYKFWAELDFLWHNQILEKAKALDFMDSFEEFSPTVDKRVYRRLNVK